MATAQFVTMDPLDPSTAGTQPAAQVFPPEKPVVLSVQQNRPTELVFVGYSKRPNKIFLGTLSCPTFRLLHPIPVDLHYDANGVTASWNEIDEFGVGSSMSAACEELGRTVVELYRSIANENESLGPDLQRVLAKLREYVEPRQ